ncbi:MAG TPA: hypothetical protein VFB52_12845, partial [Solirubrobacterales bacterium]|nr:hypothetical protein [Solirubrobacterales bacterium]
MVDVRVSSYARYRPHKSTRTLRSKAAARELDGIPGMARVEGSGDSRNVLYFFAAHKLGRLYPDLEKVKC